MKPQNNRSLQLINTYLTLPPIFYELAKQSEFPNPQLLVFNEDLAKEPGFAESLAELSDEDKAQLFSGNRFPAGAIPISQAYAGHQFGYFTMLGDGRAILLGELVGESGESYDIQLKGSGRTKYSRGGDGKAAIKPMLREYLISEAMHGLKISTTRSLAVVLTGEEIIREVFLIGAVLTRVAKSHIRVGTFQYGYINGVENLKKIADYTIAKHFPALSGLAEVGEGNRYEALLEAVVDKQARLIADWMLVGFIHGVMNTDNMALSGETIDYGPCAFMDTYNPATVFSSIDTTGRYRYENQPNMALWNLSRLGDSLLPLLRPDQDDSITVAKSYLTQFGVKYERYRLEGMRRKLGLNTEIELDSVLIEELLNQMQLNHADFTNTFVRLTLETMGLDGSYLEGTQELYANEDFLEWRFVWNDRKTLEGENNEQSIRLMQAANPFVIPRNHQVEKVLDLAEKGDMTVFFKWLEALKNPYRYEDNRREMQELPKESTVGYRTFCGT